MKLILMAPGLALFDAFERELDRYRNLPARDELESLKLDFLDHFDIELTQQSLAEIQTPWKYVFTPGNSFGLMDGGFDQVILDVLEKGHSSIQFHVMDHIHHGYAGLLPVGCAITVSAMRNGVERYVVYAPTMIKPSVIAGTTNVYWAMRAAILQVIARESGIPGIAPQVVCLVPGFGTGAGRMAPEEAARQMLLALEHVSVTLYNNDRPSLKWSDHLPTYQEIITAHSD